jgi:hypothetical protein
MPAQHQGLIIRKTKKIFIVFNWSSRSWTWSAMPAHGPRHSDISMIHIEILNGSRDTRYWIKAPYQLKYQDQGESFKIQDVNAKRSARSTLRFGESERQDLTPFLVFTDLLNYESETLCQFINLGIQSLDDPYRDLNDFKNTRYWVKAPYQLKYQDQELIFFLFRIEFDLF